MNSQNLTYQAIFNDDVLTDNTPIPLNDLAAEHIFNSHSANSQDVNNKASENNFAELHYQLQTMLDNLNSNLGAAAKPKAEINNHGNINLSEPIDVTPCVEDLNKLSDNLELTKIYSKIEELSSSIAQSQQQQASQITYIIDKIVQLENSNKHNLNKLSQLEASLNHNSSRMNQLDNHIIKNNSCFNQLSHNFTAHNNKINEIVQNQTTVINKLESNLMQQIKYLTEVFNNSRQNIVNSPSQSSTVNFHPYDWQEALSQLFNQQSTNDNNSNNQVYDQHKSLDDDAMQRILERSANYRKNFANLNRA